MTEELEKRLRRSDPLAPGWSPEPADGPQARALLERVMNTPVVEQQDHPAPPRSTRRRWSIAAGAVAVILVGAGGVWLATRGGTEQPEAAHGSARESAPGTRPPTATVTEPGAATVTFRFPGGGPTMQSCLPVTEFSPDPTSQAFAGTVIAVDSSTATLEVERWYTGTGEQADVVVLAAGTDVPVSLDGVEFVVGQRYLVTTLKGEVLICGISGPATPELETLYQRWYGS